MKPSVAHLQGTCLPAAASYFAGRWAVGGLSEMDRDSSNKCCICRVLCDGAIGWGTSLQAGRSRVLSLLGSMKYFIDLILSMALVSTGPLKRNEYRTVQRANSLVTFVCRLSGNLGFLNLLER